MYIRGMRIVFAILLFFALAGCAGNKAVYKKTDEGNFTEIILKHDGANVFLNKDKGWGEWIACAVSGIGIELQIECYEKAYMSSASELKAKSFYFKDETTLLIRIPN